MIDVKHVKMFLSGSFILDVLIKHKCDFTESITVLQFFLNFENSESDIRCC